MENLPIDLLLKISDMLSTQDRARLAVLSKDWQQLVTNNWTAISLEPTAHETEDIPHRQKVFHRLEQLAWLGRLAIQNPHTLQSLCIHPVASSTLLPELHLHHFSRLRHLELQPPQMRSILPHYASIPLVSMKSLSALTKLEVLSLIVNGRNHVEAGGGKTPEVSLDALAVLPRLKSLTLALDSDSGWNVTMLPSLRSSGFQHLKKLSLKSPGTWDTKMLAGVVSRLEVLHLLVLNPSTEVLEAPKLTYLEYVRGPHPSAPGIRVLPLQALFKLRTLFLSMVNVPKDLPVVSHDLASLCLEDTPDFVTPAIVHSWTSLTKLTHITVRNFMAEDLYVLQAFSCLAGLESLHVKFSKIPGPLDTYSRILRTNVNMAVLTKLVLESATLTTFHNLDGVGLALPALREFHARLGQVFGEVNCSTLEVLSIRCTGILHRLPVSSLLGQLPCLCTLSLHIFTDYHREKEMLAHSLPRLPSLKELTVVTRCIGWPEEAMSDRHGDTIDTILLALSANTQLRALKFVIPNSDLNLSLVNFPCLNALAVGCRAVKFDCSCLPGKSSFLDLHFFAASHSTIERFQGCQTVELTAAEGRGWKYYNVHRKGRHGLHARHGFSHSANLVSRCKTQNGMNCPFGLHHHYELQREETL